MDTVIFLALLGLNPAFIAWNKGRSFGVWWLYGFLLFIAAIFHIMIVPPNPDELARREAVNSFRDCPHCAEKIKKQATLCKHCGRDVTALDVEPTILVQDRYSGTQIA